MAHMPISTYQMTMVHQDVGTGTGSATAGTTLATFYPPVEGYLVRAAVEITVDIDPGSTVAGAIALYYNTTEIGALTLSASQDKGMFINIPVNTTVAKQRLDPSVPIYLKMKTRPTGGTVAGSVNCWLTVEEDPVQDTATGYGYYGT
ncbi:MAG: hypothetical protein WC962_03475 [Phycisphaerae bacterium]